MEQLIIDESAAVDRYKDRTRDRFSVHEPIHSFANVTIIYRGHHGFFATGRNTT